MDVRPQLLSPYAFPSPFRGFQSLFSWMSGLSSVKPLAAALWFHEVSILVFMDVRPQQDIPTLQHSVVLRVSILVFMDVRPHDADIRSDVQSLFSWMSGLSGQGQDGTADDAKFQSLFSWMSGSRPDARGVPPRRGRCFNPCFHGCQASATLIRELLAELARFQSLFSWMSGSSASGSCAGVSVYRRGFNPCFHGCQASAPGRFECRSTVYRVSILVFMDVRPQPSLGQLVNRWLARVSILVFMDVRPQPASCGHHRRWSAGFNPCFHGCQASAPSVGEHDRGRIEFQSLFSWMSGLSSGSTYTQTFNALGFNPCFHGCQASAIAVGQSALVTLRFQSLFSWMSGSSAPPRGRNMAPPRRFQSLFSWMSGLSSPDEIVGPVAHEFQSLFSWMSGLSARPSHRPSAPTSFNPCFHGCQASARMSG